MSRLVWDKISERYYETGVKKGILYPIKGGKYEKGVAWNGLISVTESSSGGESNPTYADDKKYLDLISVEEFSATIEAYAYPNEFKKCIGQYEFVIGITIGQQNKQHFGFCYSTSIGNDKDGNDYGYKIHLIYDCIASSSEKNYQTVNDSLEATTFSWDINTNSVLLENYKPTAAVVLDSTKFKSAGLANVLRKIEDVLYGSQDTDPTMLTISDIRNSFQLYMYLRDSNNELLLDSSGHQFQSFVFD